MMFIPHKKQAYGLPRPVTGKVLLFYMWMMFPPHRKHRPSRFITVRALLFYMQIMFVSHRKHTYEPPWAVTGITLLYSPT
jgi:hypothetical protein